jgi:hypothetical protein
LKKIITTSILIFIVFLAFAQNNDKDLNVIELRGKILDSETKKPVVFANIINIQKSLATLTDTSGNFRIVMLKTETIKISSIGYEIYYFNLPDTAKGLNQNTLIYLKPKIYNLSSVNIYEERWKAFVYDMSNTKIEEDENQQRLQLWMDNLVPVDELVMIATAARGFGFPINYKTSRDRQLAKVEELMMQEELNKLADEKFNKALVTKITGLQDENLDDFMKYCKFDRDFILKRTEYDLIVIVQEIFEIYKEENQ